jgi:glutaredoxin
MKLSWLNRFSIISREPSLFVGLLACVVILFSTSSLAATLYKWVDADGKISYQDRPPPKDAKILDERKIDEPEEVVQRIEGVPVVVYTLDNCERCDEVIAWLTNRGVPTEQRSLQEDREAQRQILDLSNGLTAPTLFIDDAFVTDTSEESMLEALRGAEYNLTLPGPDTTTITTSGDDGDSNNSDEVFDTDVDTDQEGFEDSTEQTPNLGVEE